MISFLKLIIINHMFYDFRSPLKDEGCPSLPYPAPLFIKFDLGNLLVRRDADHCSESFELLTVIEIDQRIVFLVACTITVYHTNVSLYEFLATYISGTILIVVINYYLEGLAYVWECWVRLGRGCAGGLGFWLPHAIGVVRTSCSMCLS